LLSNWLKAVIQLEESRSRLDVIRDRKKEFELIYAQFAPWGSRLTKIEREIALAEDAYLENLHSYNQARLHMQNTLMSANLKILDAPFFPTNDSGTKRPILIVVGFLAGIILTIATVIMLEYLDQTLKIPSEAAKKTGLSLLGVLPRFPDRKSGFANPAKLNFPLIRNRAMELIYQKLVLGFSEKVEEPRIVLVTSIRGMEGVSTFSSLLTGRMRKEFNRVLHLCPGVDQQQDSVTEGHPDRVYFNPDSIKTDSRSNKSLIKVLGIDDPEKKYDFICIEVPALMTAQFPLKMISQAHELVLVCRANRIWTNADSNVLNTLKNAFGKPPALLVNGVRAEAMEDFLGDLPKPRSRFKKAVKQFARFNFSGQNSI
jgi:hypothetical protein